MNNKIQNWIGQLPASIEMLPKQVLSTDELDALPRGIRIYLTDVGSAGSGTEMLKAAQRIRDCGFIPVPHLAARRMNSAEGLARHVGRLAEEAGVTDVLVVGGGVDPAHGPFKSSIDVLETGILDRYGISDLAVAGHPEGSPDFSEVTALEALRTKQAFAERTGARLRIVTQFSFDAARVLAWAGNLQRIGIGAPVHMGVAGPAKISTLIKYGKLCGIGNSLSFLTRHAGVFSVFAKGYSPETVVGPVERNLGVAGSDIISHIHVFPFGGVDKAAEWLRRRGSWPTVLQGHGAADQAGKAR